MTCIIGDQSGQVQQKSNQIKYFKFRERTLNWWIKFLVWVWSRHGRICNLSRKGSGQVMTRLNQVKTRCRTSQDKVRVRSGPCFDELMATLQWRNKNIIDICCSWYSYTYIRSFNSGFWGKHYVRWFSFIFVIYLSLCFTLKYIYMLSQLYLKSSFPSILYSVGRVNILNWNFTEYLAINFCC